MIDLHNHLLPGVDDGAKDLDTTIEMLKCEIAQGVTACILTPHYKHFNANRELERKSIFNNLKKTVKDLGLKVELFLGKEVYYSESTLDHPEVLSFDNSPYVLVEFSTNRTTDIEEAAYNLTVLKLKPIIAHVERYRYLTKNDYYQIKQTGALLQMNAGAIQGLEGFGKRKLIHFLLKNQLIDLVASDAHNTSTRKPNLEKAYHYVNKKYGKAYADSIFNLNPKQIIESIQ